MFSPIPFALPLAQGGKLRMLGVTTLERIEVIADVPPLTTVLLEDAVGPGPFRAKAIGEGSISAVAPAIANAVADACGVRILDLPITAEKVYFALRAREQRAREKQS